MYCSIWVFCSPVCLILSRSLALSLSPLSSHLLSSELTVDHLYFKVQPPAFIPLSLLLPRTSDSIPLVPSSAHSLVIVVYFVAHYTPINPAPFLICVCVI